jgi:hypothetical protein
MAAAGCGAPDQDQALESVGSGETVISGTVTHDGAPVPSAYVRLLDSGGEFTAEVATGSAGAFRFFAAPGSWTVRALSASGNGEQAVSAQRGLNTVSLELV